MTPLSFHILNRTYLNTLNKQHFRLNNPYLRLNNQYIQFKQSVPSVKQIKNTSSSYFHTDSDSYIPNQIITNGNAPACKDCLYFKKIGVNNYFQSKCFKFGTKDLLSGIINYEYAENVRNVHNNKCGIQGKHFIAKDVIH